MEFFGQSRYKDDLYEIRDILFKNGITSFYHFTARENLPKIKEYGGLYSWWSLYDKGLEVPFMGGDNDPHSPSHDMDRRLGLEDYVRLSFCDDHPMAYRHKLAGKQLVLLEIDIEVAWWQNTIFADRNATKSNVRGGKNAEALKLVDFHAVTSHYVRRNDPEFEKHQAEVMVKTFLPIQYITNIDNPRPL